MCKIVHVVNRLEVGGVEVGVINLLKKNHGELYEVVAIKGFGDDVYKCLSKEELSRVHACNGYVSALIKIIKINPKIVFSSLWRAHFVSSIYRFFFSKTKRIHFVHNIRYAHLIDRLLTNISFFLCDEVVCDSEKSQKWFYERKKNSSCTILPMNVSFSNEVRTLDLSSYNFVFVGRFCKQKNLEVAIDLISFLKGKGFNVSFSLYGRDDGELDNLKNYAKQLALTDIVFFNGSLLPTEVESILRKYNFYLQTSHVEGMAISVFQALKNGLIPVVTPVGEIANYTSHNLNAFHLDIYNQRSSFEEFERNLIGNVFSGYSIGKILRSESYLDFSESFFSYVNELKNR